MNMAKEPKAKEHSKKSKAKEYTKTCLEYSTEQSESNPGRSLGIKAMTRKAVWKTVPSEARVTRDEVSGLKP